MYKIISLLTISSLLCTSCCTMIAHPEKRIMITSEQPQTEISIDGHHCGTAPLIVDLDKKQNHTVVGSKPGYQQQQIILSSKHTLRSGTNLVAGPLVGAAVGTGIGLIAFAPFNFFLPMYLIGTTIGGSVGLGVGCAGAATDCYLRNDCDLNSQSVHFDLNQTNQP